MSVHRSLRESIVSRLARVGAAVVLVMALVGAPAAATAAPLTASTVVTPPPGLTMEASALLDGHARVGAWMAIDVHLKNDGPPLAGELRLTGGTQGRTRFGTAVEAPTQSDQMHRLCVQPPGFGSEMEISLVPTLLGRADTAALAAAACRATRPSRRPRRDSPSMT